MPRNTDNESFSAKETKERFEAALRGVRVAGHKPMKAMSPKAAPAKKGAKKK
jgi:hypothetical protein